MKKITGSMLLLSVLIAGIAHGGEFVIASPQVTEGATLGEEQVFNGFGCSGKNISPALRWKGAPEGAKSFAVTVYDPDAPTGSGWWHWVIFNIPAGVTELKENAGNLEANLAPEGSIQSMTDFGKPGFGGPCPPEGHGPHRYIFTVHALKTEKLPLDKNAPAAMVGFYLWMNTIEKASLTAYYSR